jgi:hypothetical protein
MIKDTKVQSINAELANGETIFANDGSSCRFDRAKGSFVHVKGKDVHYFKQFGELASFIAFFNAETDKKEETATKNRKWFVLTAERVYSNFHTKQEASDFCVQAFENQPYKISKINQGIYVCALKKNSVNSYYIGIRENLIESGFGEQIKKWEEKQK